MLTVASYDAHDIGRYDELCEFFEVMAKKLMTEAAVNTLAIINGSFSNTVFINRKMTGEEMVTSFCTAPIAMGVTNIEDAEFRVDFEIENYSGSCAIVPFTPPCFGTKVHAYRGQRDHDLETVGIIRKVLQAYGKAGDFEAEVVLNNQYQNDDWYSKESIIEGVLGVVIRPVMLNGGIVWTDGGGMD